MQKSGLTSSTVSAHQYHVGVMSTDLFVVAQHLSSPNKLVRLRALKLLFRHPDATPLQLVQGLCSTDNRNGEFLQVFELHAAMRECWRRVRGVTDREVYEYLAEQYIADPQSNAASVLGVLRELATPQALEMLDSLRPALLSDVTPLSFEFIRRSVVVNLTGA